MRYIDALMDMSARRTLITGAAGGLGQVMAQSVAELSSDLVLVDLPSVDMSKQAAQLELDYQVDVRCISADLEKETDRKELVKQVAQIGGLNVLINNAAFVGTSSLSGWSEKFEKQSLETWRRALEVNLTSAFHLTQLLTPQLKQNSGLKSAGSVINIASIYGRWGPDWSLYDGTDMANPAAYSASKGGLLQLTRWLSTTLAPDIRVNAISPGGVRRDQDQSFVDRYERRTPLGRMAEKDDFRGAIAYLASDMSAYVTGQTLAVDGGWGSW